jgi:hypothetical protein
VEVVVKWSRHVLLVVHYASNAVGFNSPDSLHLEALIAQLSLRSSRIRSLAFDIAVSGVVVVGIDFDWLH